MQSINQQAFEKAKQLITDPYWRINNLYKIIDKEGTQRVFKLNLPQQKLYRDMWYCNIILKARQLGMSTFIGLLFLDRCFFNANMSAGIIAHTREDAQVLFRRIKYAYDNLPESLKLIRRSVVDSASEMKFENGSSIRVATSMRSTTLNYLHISEFGPICARYPEKAEEIITGSLNTLAPGQACFIESTAEGKGSYFYDMCQTSIKAKKEKINLTNLDFRFHFFPWFDDPAYKLDQYIDQTIEQKQYFSDLQNKGILLSGAQQSWYIKKKETLQDKMYQEFPSLPEEAFTAGASGHFYTRELTIARNEKRIGNVPWDINTEVHTAWDLGISASGYAVVWFFQVCGNEIHFIDFYQCYGISFAELIAYVKAKPYCYGTHFMPHDVGVHEFSFGYSRMSIANQLGIFPFVVNKEEGKPVTSVAAGIEAVRGMFNRCWFHEPKCKEGIEMLENYHREWDERLCKWSDNPVKDISCHAADGFRMSALGIPKLNTSQGSVEKDYAALRKFWGG